MIDIELINKITKRQAYIENALLYSSQELTDFATKSDVLLAEMVILLASAVNELETRISELEQRKQK